MIDGGPGSVGMWWKCDTGALRQVTSATKKCLHSHIHIYMSARVKRNSHKFGTRALLRTKPYKYRFIDTSVRYRREKLRLKLGGFALLRINDFLYM